MLGIILVCGLKEMYDVGHFDFKSEDIGRSHLPSLIEISHEDSKSRSKQLKHDADINLEKFGSVITFDGDVYLFWTSALEWWKAI